MALLSSFPSVGEKTILFENEDWEIIFSYDSRVCVKAVLPLPIKNEDESLDYSKKKTVIIHVYLIERNWNGTAHTTGLILTCYSPVHFWSLGYT